MLKRSVAMAFLWNEYCDAVISRGEKPNMLTAFTNRHRKWKKANTLSKHIDKKPADQIQVDWVGDIMYACNPDTEKT